MKKPFLLFLSLFIIIGCGTNNNTGAQNPDKEQITEKTEKSQDKNQQRQNITLPAPKPIEPNFITRDKWRVSSVVGSDEASKEQFSGLIFEIQDNGMFYVRDSNNNEVYSGVFRYEESNDLLRFYPKENEDEWTISEWKVQFNGSLIALTGTSSYKDNGVIMLLKQYTE